MSRHSCLDNVKFDILLLAITHCIYLVGMRREKATLFYYVPPQWRLWKWEKIMYDFKICSDFNILRFNQPILLSFFIPSHALLVSCFSPSLFSICSFVSHTFSPSAVAQSQLFLNFPSLPLHITLAFLPFLPIAALTTQWTKEMIICAEKARQLCSIAWICSHCCPVLGPLSSFSSFPCSSYPSSFTSLFAPLSSPLFQPKSAVIITVSINEVCHPP